MDQIKLTLEIGANEHIQVSADGTTVWVHAFDGSTVGRFSKKFGMDVHNTAADQMAGSPECLHCTHVAPSEMDWTRFCELLGEHHKIAVDPNILQF